MLLTEHLPILVYSNCAVYKPCEAAKDVGSLIVTVASTVGQNAEADVHTARVYEREHLDKRSIVHSVLLIESVEFSETWDRILTFLGSLKVRNYTKIRQNYQKRKRQIAVLFKGKGNNNFEYL